MRILFTTDIHTYSNHLYTMIDTVKKEKAECLIIGGDIFAHDAIKRISENELMNYGNYVTDTLIPELKSLHESTGCRIFLDLGNDDWLACRHLLEKYDGVIFSLLHMQKHSLTDDVDIIGYMNVPPTPFTRKDREKIDTLNHPFIGGPVKLKGVVSGKGTIEPYEIIQSATHSIEHDLSIIESMIDKPFVFVSHSPPYQTNLDVIFNGTHVGSRAIRQFIECYAQKNVMILSLHGHIHESPKISGSISSTINKCLCINPGQSLKDRKDFCYVMLELKDKLQQVRLIQS
ncbi:MAG: metallophosphoesterase [Desulfobacterales bacterium]|nr:metallophosphoesterase [Desulfobacterales bacterium]